MMHSINPGGGGGGGGIWHIYRHRLAEYFWVLNFENLYFGVLVTAAEFLGLIL